MTGAMLFYLLTISFWLVLAALTAEWLLIRLRLPARWTWAVAMLLCVALPFLPAPRLTERPTAAAGGVTEQPASRAVANDAAMEVTPAAHWLTTVDVPQSWLVVSSTLTLLSLALGWALLTLRSRRWARSELDGIAVLVAPATGPAVIGFVRPRIVVPRWAFEVPVEQRRMLLAHEQGHIDARDPLLLLTAALVVAAMPWNPLLWLALHRLRGAIEIDCDARVLGGGEEARSYARCLVDSVTLSTGGAVPAVGALSLSSSHLERRVALMLHPSRPFKIVSVVVALAGAALVTAAFRTTPPVSAESPPAVASAAAKALEISTRRTENYYNRLREGKLVSDGVLYGVFYDNWSVRDPNRKGEGC